MPFDEKSVVPGLDRAALPRPGRPAREGAPGVSPLGLRSPQALAALQQTAGNAAVVQTLRDEQEQEQHRHGAGCGHQPPVQRSSVDEALRSPGRPLEPAKREEMESRLGADFSSVRVHTDTVAQRSASELGARAWTSGNDVVLGPGGGDDHTLAHELTHVIQQSKGPVDGTVGPGGVRVSDPGDRFEREAEANATRAMSAPLPEVQRAPARSGAQEYGAAVGDVDAVQRARHATERAPDSDNDS